MADLAARDTGTLRKWSLDIGLETVAQVARGQSTLSFDIPDNVPVGVSSAIALVEAGSVQAIKVSVDITHSYIGDLRVDLAAPSGQVVTLHNRAGGGQDNLIQVYDSAAMPALAALAGQPIQGNWTLRVADLAGRDIGKLNQWGVEVSC